MRRGLCFLALFLLLGVYVGFYADMASAFLMSLLFIVACGCKWLISRKKADVIYFVGALVFVFGIIHVIYQGDITLKKLYPYIDEYVTVTAEVAERPKVENEKAVFVAKITELKFLDEKINPMEEVRITCREQGYNLQYGDIITARIRMNLPSVAENEGGFDYRLYLRTKKVFLSGYVDGKSLEVCGRKDFKLLDYVRIYHYKCCDLIDSVLTEETAPFLNGILLGNKSGMSEEMRGMLSRSGLAHVAAVSGMHVSIVSTLIYAILRVLRVKRRRQGVIAAGFVVIFVLVSGATVSAVRAGIMTIMSILAWYVYRKDDSYTSMALTAAILIVAWPYAAFDAGFLLSFGATFGILLFSARIELLLLNILGRIGIKSSSLVGKASAKLISFITTSLSAQMITLPVVLYLYQEFSVWSLLTNLIVLPMLSVVMLSGLLLCTFGFVAASVATVCAGMGYPFLLAIRKTVIFFGGLEIGIIPFGQITIFFVFMYILFLVFVYLISDKKYRKNSLIPALAFVLSFSISTVYTYTNDKAKIMFINVGQGDCSCISMPRGVDILIDAGGTASYQDYYDVGLKIVRPYLLKQGVNSIEFMIASHGHEDHVMGLISIMSKADVGELLVPEGFGKTEAGEKLLMTAYSENVPVRELSAGDVIEFSPTARLEVLMPDKEWSSSLEEERENDRSLVLRFSYGENSFLYTGDLEGDGEERLIKNSGEKLKSDVLKVAHHGSATSTAYDFVSFVKPSYAFIPVGENSYGHPDEGVLNNLERNGTEIFRADIDNDVVFTVDLKGILSISDGMIGGN